MVDAREKVARLDKQAKVAEKLRRQMRAQGLRQVEVARVLGLNPEQMSKYMNARIPWAGGLEDFEASIIAAIEKAVMRRRAAA